MPSLYAHQTKTLLEVQTALARGRAPLVVMPTGSGKTIVFAELARQHRVRNPQARAFFVVHRIELAAQTAAAVVVSQKKIPRVLVGSGKIFAMKSAYKAARDNGNDFPDTDERNIVVSVMMLKKQPELMRRGDLVIFDEAHHAVARTWRAVWQQAQHCGAHYCGWTATPERTDGEGLHAVFDLLVLGLPAKQLVAEKHLAPTRTYAPVFLDFGGIKRRGGDFAKEELEAFMSESKVVDGVTEHFKKCFGNDKQAIAFCVSREHARLTCKSLQAAGVTSAIIEGKQTPQERAAVVRALQSGDIQVMVSIDIVSEGFDAPRVHGVVLIRPTQSLALYLQQVGRAMRYQPDKVAIVLDLAGNTYRHGNATMERVWSLFSTKRKQSAYERRNAMLVWGCVACNAVNDRERTHCIECGAEAPPAKIDNLTKKESALFAGGGMTLPPEVAARVVCVHTDDMTNLERDMRLAYPEHVANKIYKECRQYPQGQMSLRLVIAGYRGDELLRHITAMCRHFKTKQGKAYSDGWAFHQHQDLSYLAKTLDRLADEKKRGLA